MKRLTSLAAATSAVLLATHTTPAAETSADAERAPFAGIKELQDSHASRTAWFKEARFGMFIHWGLYSAAGGCWPPNPETGKKYEQHYAEWIKVWAKVPEPEYGRLLKPLFQPEPGCTDEWARLAKAAGMRYAVLTTKHHEGYTLFNSRAPYSLENPVTGGTNISPDGRDLFREYVESFRAQDVVPGAYFSLIDWQHPDKTAYKAYLKQHLTELATHYGPVGILWVDYSSANAQGSHWGTRDILETWLEHQPAAVYNNRFWDKLENNNGDFFTPEKYVPATGYPDRIFEVCHTLNESFGYSHHDQKWKTPEQVLHLLTDIVSKGGNLLLNIGPDAKGRIPEPSVKTLEAVGKWLETHGDSIYGTDASPFGITPFNGRVTTAARDGQHVLYCHLHEWPADGELRLNGLLTPISSAKLLGADSTTFEVTDGIIKLPASAPDAGNPVPVIAVTLTGEPEVDKLPYPRQAGNRSVTLAAGHALLQPASPKEGIRHEGPHIGWWSNPGDSVWFHFVMDRPGKVVHTGGTAGEEPGRYQVTLDIACNDGAGGEVEIRLLDQTLRVPVSSTGGWNEFKPLDAGTITLSQPGLLALHIKPATIRGQGLMNLRGIRLTPVD